MSQFFEENDALALKLMREVIKLILIGYFGLKLRCEIGQNVTSQDTSHSIT